LLLLRRPSFWRVLFHVATTFYPLLILIMTAVSFPVDCYAGNVLWVVSWATFLAGLPEAMAAGRWARLVYYAVLLFWISLIVMPLVAKLLS
jgi:archaellum biogenesis protein FlaJ (TadC family)